MFRADNFVWGYYHYASIAILTFILLAIWERRRISKLPYPPGPKGLPLIGNVLDIPTSREWLTYAQWSRQYGIFPFLFEELLGSPPADSSLIHLNLSGTHLLIVNSAEAAYELFDKRSAIYSDRVRHMHSIFIVGTSLIYVSCSPVCLCLQNCKLESSI
jgi:hypothetical protein